MLTPNTNDELTYLLSSPNELSPYVAANVSSYDQKSVQEQTVISPSIFSPVDKSKQYRKRTSLDFYNQSSNFVPSTCEAKRYVIISVQLISCFLISGVKLFK